MSDKDALKRGHEESGEEESGEEDYVPYVPVKQRKIDLLERHNLRRNEPTLEELRAAAEAKKQANKRPEAGPLAKGSLLQEHDKLQLARSAQKVRIHRTGRLPGRARLAPGLPRQADRLSLSCLQVDELEKQLKEEAEIMESIKNAASKGLMSAEELAKGIKCEAELTSQSPATLAAAVCTGSPPDLARAHATFSGPQVRGVDPDQLDHAALPP